MRTLALIPAALLALAACRQEQAALPEPVAMSADALGYYCQMALGEHDGPKAQVHLAGAPAPLFFSQVRDAIAYQRMPEQDAPVVVIYVSDMGRAHSWNDPGIDNWIAATDAFFVVGADVTGGMGASEIVPFASRESAATFAGRRGGRVASLAGIADTEVLAPVAKDAADPGEGDYLDRLKALSSEGNG